MTIIFEFALLLNFSPLSFDDASYLVEVCGFVNNLILLFEMKLVGGFFPIWPMDFFHMVLVVDHIHGLFNF